MGVVVADGGFCSRWRSRDSIPRRHVTIKQQFGSFQGGWTESHMIERSAYADVSRNLEFIHSG
jgi:hypothetical protein